MEEGRDASFMGGGVEAVDRDQLGGWGVGREWALVLCIRLKPALIIFEFPDSRQHFHYEQAGPSSLLL